MRASERIRQRLEGRARELGYASVAEAREDFHKDIEALLARKRQIAAMTHEEFEAAKAARQHGRVVVPSALVLAVLDDIEAGRPGGSYYLDGTFVTAGGRDLYAVGGAERAGIVLELGELASEDNVRATLELLGEHIAQLQETGAGTVVIGYWVNDGLCYFDASDVVEGRERAEALALSRRQIAYFGFAEMREYRTDFLKKRHPELDALISEAAERRRRFRTDLANRISKSQAAARTHGR